MVLKRFAAAALCLIGAAVVFAVPVRHSEAQYLVNPYAPTYQVRASVGLKSSGGVIDSFCIEGATGQVRLLYLSVGGVSGGAQINVPITLFLRTALDTGGTSVTSTWVARDSKDAATTVVFRKWDVSAPTVLGAGTAFDGGTPRLGDASATLVSVVFDYTSRGKVLTLNGASEAVCVSYNATPLPAGSTFDVTAIIQQG
jgi:hypothetical protein